MIKNIEYDWWEIFDYLLGLINKVRRDECFVIEVQSLVENGIYCVLNHLGFLVLLTLVPNLNIGVRQTICICRSQASTLVNVCPQFEISWSLELFDGHHLFHLFEILHDKSGCGVFKFDQF